MPVFSPSPTIKPVSKPITTSNFIANAPKPNPLAGLGAPKTPPAGYNNPYLAVQPKYPTQGPQPVSQPVGVKAASPDSNVKPPTTTLASKDQSPNQPNLTPSASQNQQVLGGSATPPAPQTPAATPPAPQNQPYTVNNGLYGQLITGLANKGASPEYTGAIGEAQRINAELAKSRENEAKALYGVNHPANNYGRSLEYQQGAGAYLQNMYLNQQNALSSQFQGQSNLVSAANTQQGLQQQALSSAAGYAAPQLAAYGQGYYNPVTQGQPGGNFGQGPAAAANVASIQSQTQQVNDMSAALNAAGNLQNQLTNLLQSGGVNPSDFSAVNRFLQKLGKETSSPQYQTFHNLVNELAGTYASVIGIGGDTTNLKTEIAQSMLDATASGKSIVQVLQGLDQAARGKIAGIQQNIQSLQGGGLQGGTGGGGLWDF